MTLHAVKFNFDRTFDEAERSEAESHASDRAAELEAARQISYAAGFSDGEIQAQNSLNAQIALLQTSIEAQLATLVSAITATQRLLVADAALCIGTLAETVAGEALLHLPIDRIEGIVAPVLMELLETPRMVLRISPTLLDGVKERMEDVAISLGFGGKIIFLGEDSLQPGDVLIEWAHGGLDARIEQSRKNLSTAVSDFVQSAVSGNLPPVKIAANGSRTI
jgi:flagellar biosynthesis/type III secretory pathway protein FliH